MDNKKMTLDELAEALEAIDEDIYCCWCAGGCGTAISEYGRGGGAILRRAWAYDIDDPDPSGDDCYCSECYVKYKAEQEEESEKEALMWSAAWQELY